MQKALVRNSDNFVENIIEIEANSNWQIPIGYRLDDPVKFPLAVPVTSDAPSKTIGEMTPEEFKQAVDFSVAAVAAAAIAANADIKS